jgi:hypothetical protein
MLLSQYSPWRPVRCRFEPRVLVALTGEMLARDPLLRVAGAS